MNEEEKKEEEILKEFEKEEIPPKKKIPIALIILIVLILLTVIAVLGVYFWYNQSIEAVDVNNKENKVVKIESGKGTAGIAETLKENDLIKYDISFKIYCKLNNINNLQAGTYELSPSMSVEEIVKKLQSGEIVKKEISIMFPEGKNIRSIAKIIEKNTNNTYEDVMSILESKTYAKGLIEKYWFLTDEILDSNIYYALEGYLYPNTYTFESADVKVEDIIERMLKQTDKILSKYQMEINSKGYTVHKFLSLASLVENEGKNTVDRQGIAGVFSNRIKKNMALQSDVTTYYAFKIDMGERDLTSKELHTYNKYNTRGPNMEGKIPVGPISNVSESSIEAVLKPTNIDALFFVADKNGKVYFSKTNEEHEQTIKKLQEQNLWYTYD